MRKTLLPLALACSLSASELSDYVIQHRMGAVPLDAGRIAYSMVVVPPPGYTAARFQYTKSPTVQEFVLLLEEARGSSYLNIIDENADGVPDRATRIQGTTSTPVAIKGELAKFYNDAFAILSAQAKQERQSKAITKQ